MEKILLSDAPHTVCAFGKAFGIQLAHNAFHPYIHGEGINLAEAVKQGTLCHLFADTLDFYKFIPAFIKSHVENTVQINLAACNLAGGIDYVFRPEARSYGRKPFNACLNYFFR